MKTNVGGGHLGARSRPISVFVIFVALLTIDPPSGSAGSCDGVWIALPPLSSSETGVSARAIDARGPADAWTVGSANSDSPFSSHWNGTQWTEFPAVAPVRQAEFQDVSIAAPRDVWAVGNFLKDNRALVPLLERWRGESWRRFRIPAPAGRIGRGILYGVDAPSRSDVWAVGVAIRKVLVLRWDGSSWSRVALPHRLREGRAFDVVANGPDDVWILMDQTALHWDGDHWHEKKLAVPDGAAYGWSAQALSVIDDEDVWAVGYAELSAGAEAILEHWDGRRWRALTIPMDPGLDYMALAGIAASSSDDIWAVGVGHHSDDFEVPLAMHWDGVAWTSKPSPIDFGALSDVAATGVSTLAVGFDDATATSSVFATC
jgi:hypothetical protein